MNSITEIDITDREIYELKYARYGQANMYIRCAICFTWFDLYREISQALRFPPYFGWNFPAMDECLHDLDDWMSFDHIVWIFDDWQLLLQAEEHPEILREKLKEYFSEVADHWRSKGIPIDIYINSRSSENDCFTRKAMMRAARQFSDHTREWLVQNILNP